ncbi:hypothetical protein M878_43560 [Streptomyces roseochromogenus subsp. oscitans DS 12.976]|uniref:Uncharacterized protein n=1 Tax=Streptomyces roseochromogenus subsp. oscitans DS 12.976 TaxID=1352936 RepID=V6JG30_STRRC|nr:hypothetical protein M878_43560 [Streptomyces roseochromogenus subsp. oscitans DS 12.976]
MASFLNPAMRVPAVERPSRGDAFHMNALFYLTVRLSILCGGQRLREPTKAGWRRRTHADREL